MGHWKQVKDANWAIPYTGGWCLSYVQSAFGAQHTSPNAITEWNSTTKYNHTDYPPAGITVPVYFTLGTEPAGHVAIRLDDLKVASSTQSGVHQQGYLHPNIQDLMNIYAKYNGGCTYLGWSEVIGNTRVVEYISDNATDDQIRQAFLDILERQVDADALAHYRNYTNDFVRSDLLASVEYKTLQAKKAEAIRIAQEEANNPKVLTHIEVETKSIPFKQETITDDKLALGASLVKVAGVNGVETINYSITTTNGVETARSVSSDEVILAPVNQVTAIGTGKVDTEEQTESDHTFILRLKSLIAIIIDFFTKLKG